MADGGSNEPKKVVAHKAGGGNVKITEHKEDYSGVEGKVGTSENIHHKPGGAHAKIFDEHLDFSNVKSTVQDENSTYVPGGGNKKIENHHLHFKDRARSRTDTGLVDEMEEKEEEPTEFIPEALAVAPSPRRHSASPHHKNN